MKVVLDVNVWISALLWRGVPGQILDLANNQQITIFISQPILQELADSLSRPKLQARINILNTDLKTLLEVTQNLSQLCSIFSLEVPQLRDPDDVIILATALAVKADVIITGDLDLLILNEFEGIPILTPSDFLKHYESFR